MSETAAAYSTLFHCLYDQPRPVVAHYGHYSIFRAIDSRDVTQQPTTLPRIHDFAVIWDDDHDVRIIAIIEEMLMAGMLPGVQFIGEHKGTLTIILAARTYFLVDVEAFGARAGRLTAAVGDYWNVQVGMFDHSPDSLRSGHQCDFQEILGLPEAATHAYLLAIDGMWKLGTKQWPGFDASLAGPIEGLKSAWQIDRYVVSPRRP